jgi:hypothetical protein
MHLFAMLALFLVLAEVMAMRQLGVVVFVRMKGGSDAPTPLADPRYGDVSGDNDRGCGPGLDGYAGAPGPGLLRGAAPLLHSFQKI